MMRRITTCALVWTLFAWLLGCSGGENNTSWYPVDMDGDQYTQYTDCDDDDPLAHPGALERLDGIDNDCDGVIDNGAAETEPTWYYDWDGDGHGVDLQPGDARYDEFTRQQEGSPGENWVESHDDCNDESAATYPGAAEVCDDDDNDCNGHTDDVSDGPMWYVDIDRDGYGQSIDGIDRMSCDWPGNGWSSNAEDADPTNPNEH